MGFGVAGFVIAIFSIFIAGFFGHLVGLPLSIVGLVKTRKREDAQDNRDNRTGRGLSIAGIVINGAGVLSVIGQILRQIPPPGG